MTPAPILCPGCRAPLAVPATAVGTTAGCPHCGARFRLPAAGSPELLPPPRRPPARLLAPAVGLLLVGVAGLLVNGSVAVRTALDPAGGLAVARGMVQQDRLFEALAAGSKGAEFADPAGAAAAGVAAASFSRDARDEAVAAARAGAVGRRAWQFLPVSAVAAAGGLCLLFGRGYWVGVLGCVAAAVNLNHLCFAPGLPVGLFGLFTLARDDVRAHFRGAGPMVQNPGERPV